MELDDVISLADAATELGVAGATLRQQAKIGRIQAKNIGISWITTRQEVARYRRDQLGRRGSPMIVGRVPLPEGWPRDELRILGYPETPKEHIAAVTEIATVMVAEGVTTVREIITEIRALYRSNELILSSGEVTPYIGIARVVPHDHGNDMTTAPMSQHLLEDSERTLTHQVIGKPTREPGH